MKKLLTLLLTVFMLSLLVINNNKEVKAEENIDCSSATEGQSCSISNATDLNNWASNSNNITGVLSNDIELSLTTGLSFNSSKTLDLNGRTIKINENFTANYLFSINDASGITLTVKDSSGNNSGSIDGGYGVVNNPASLCLFYIVGAGNKLVIESGTFKNTYIKDTNGSVVDNGGATVEINGGIFKNNYVYYTNPTSHVGGVISNANITSPTAVTGNLTIKNATFDACNSNAQGGAIVNLGKLTMNNVIIKNCKATSSPALYIHSENSEKNSVENVTIESCEATVGTDNTGAGGAIVNAGGELTLKDVNIKSCKASYAGGAIFNHSSINNAKLILNNVNISECETLNDGLDNPSTGGAIYNGGELEIDGGSIKNCKSGFSGGAISDTGTNDVKISNFLIQGCKADYVGGGISKADSMYTLENVEIKSCESGMNGAAIIQTATGTENSSSCLVILKNSKIENCKSEHGAITAMSDGSIIKLIGEVTLNNVNELGIKDDILLLEGGVVKLGANFNTTKKIAIGDAIEELGPGKQIDNAISLDGYTLKPQEKLKDTFISSDGQVYLIENSNTNTISIKSVQITSHPMWPNYTVTTDANGTPINVSYQWYKTDILEETSIGDVGHYPTVAGKYLDFDVELDAESKGTYQNNVWKKTATDSNDSMFKLAGFKKNSRLSFDFEGGSGTTYVDIALIDEQYHSYGSATVDSSTGTFSVTVPKDGDFWLMISAEDNNEVAKDVTISNVLVEYVSNEQALSGETTSKIYHPEADADIYLRVKYQNSEGGATAYEYSNSVKFGKVLKGDKQEVVKGTNKEVEIKIDATSAEYNYFKNSGGLYLDGLDDTLNKLESPKDYTHSEGSIIIKLDPTLITGLPLGKHTFFVKKSNDSGKECTVGTLYIVNPVSPSPDPSPKDESCEKVIGPTWHWNESKGICEDVGVVGTSTR